MALELVAEQITKPALRKIVSAWLKNFRAAVLFSQAVSHYPAAFSYAYYQIIKAMSRRRPRERFATDSWLLEKQIKITGNIRRAMTYPAIIVVMAIGVSILMITVVLPPIMNLFKSVGLLCLDEKMLIAIVNFITVYNYRWSSALWRWRLPYILYFRTSAGKRTKGQMMLQMPLIGQN